MCLCVFVFVCMLVFVLVLCLELGVFWFAVRLGTHCDTIVVGCVHSCSCSLEPACADCGSVKSRTSSHTTVHVEVIARDGLPIDVPLLAASVVSCLGVECLPTGIAGSVSCRTFPSVFIQCLSLRSHSCVPVSGLL